MEAGAGTRAGPGRFGIGDLGPALGEMNWRGRRDIFGWWAIGLGQCMGDCKNVSVTIRSKYHRLQDLQSVWDKALSEVDHTESQQVPRCQVHPCPADDEPWPRAYTRVQGHNLPRCARLPNMLDRAGLESSGKGQRRVRGVVTGLWAGRQSGDVPRYRKVWCVSSFILDLGRGLVGRGVSVKQDEVVWC